MLRPKLFIEGQEVDLFEDERIQFDLNLKDLKQFEKTIGSYTQPFTVPASKNNNKIFEHYYNSSVNTNYNPNVSIAATLEINNIPFRTGTIKLEGSEVRNGQPFSYNIVFYDAIVNLKDQLGDKRLYDIGWTYSMDVTARTDSFSDTYDFTGSLRNAAFMPLIGCNTYLRYNKDSSDSFDRNTTRFLINETRPAVSVKYLLDQIQTNTGLTINYPIGPIGNPDGATTSSAEGCLYLFCNRSKGKLVDVEKPWTLMQTRAVIDDDSSIWDSSANTLDIVSGTGDALINIFIYENVAQVEDWSAEVCAYDTGSGEIIDIINLSKQNFRDRLRVPRLPSSTRTIQFYFRTGNPIWLGFSPGGNWSRFRIQSGTPAVNTAVELENFIEPNEVDGAKMYFADKQYTSLGETYTAPGQLPNIKIFDFLVGLAKLFNWVLIFKDNQYTFETFDVFYSTGGERNWTEYVDRLNYKATKVDFYGEIKFLYEPTDSILGKQYYETVGGGEYGYGDLVTRVEDPEGNLISSESYEVKPGFSSIIWERPSTIDADDKNFYIANAVDIDGEPVEMKPLLMYYNGQVTINDSDTFKINRQQDTTTETDITEVHVASDRSDNSTTFSYSLNFGSEINIANNLADPSGANTLYNNFYEDFITDLYDLNARYYEFTAALPLGEILELDLSDTIIIGNEKYFINSISVDLTTGKAKLNLRNVIE